MIIPSGQTVKIEDTPGARPIIQNNGDGVLYIGSTATKKMTHTAGPDGLFENGLKLEKGCVYEVPTTLVEGLGDLWAYADGTCDVRVLNVG